MLYTGFDNSIEKTFRYDQLIIFLKSMLYFYVCSYPLLKMEQRSNGTSRIEIQQATVNIAGMCACRRCAEQDGV